MAMLNPCHRGEILRDNPEATELSVTAAASRLGCTRQALSPRLLNGKAGISPVMALALEWIGWSNAGLWMRLQSSYELAQARRGRVGLPPNGARARCTHDRVSRLHRRVGGGALVPHHSRLPVEASAIGAVVALAWWWRRSRERASERKTARERSSDR